MTISDGPNRQGPPPRQVRQGDVLLHPVAEVPETAQPLPRTAGRVVLAEGEATGHAHAIRATGATMLADGDDRYLRVAGAVTLNHEEHAAIELVPGAYKVVIQREYVPAETATVSWNRVRD